MKKQDQAVKKMVAENNELREQLTKENREYYENLLAYLRGKSLLRDDYQVEQNLSTILQDLIDAQADGVDAAAYFGKNPEAIADDLLKTIPLNLTDFFWFNLKMVFMMLFIFWIPQLVRPVMIVDIGMALLCGIIAVIGSWGVLWLLAHHAFTKHPRLETIELIVYSVIIVIVLFFISVFFKPAGESPFPRKYRLQLSS